MITERGIGRAAVCAGVALLAGCSTSLSYLPGVESRPAMIVAIAYTRDGCVDKLRQEAEKRQLKIDVTKVVTEWGFGALSFPFYRDYQCHGEAQSPTAAN